MARGKSNGNIIYAIYCDKANEWYIGRTFNASLRFKQHIKDKQSAIYRWVKEYGENHIYMMVIKAGLSIDEAVAYETKYIYENYFKFQLVNRSLPRSMYLLPFCEDEKTTKYWLSLCRKIDEDINKKSGRSRYITGRCDYQNGRCNYTQFFESTLISALERKSKSV